MYIAIINLLWELELSARLMLHSIDACDVAFSPQNCGTVLPNA